MSISPGDRVPVTVREFLIAHITSMGALKVLLTLISGGDRWWDARSVAVYAGVDVTDARWCLEEFAAKNLLDIRISDAVRYQLRPGTRELEDRVEALVTAYRKWPAAVVGCATALSGDLASKADGN